MIGMIEETVLRNIVRDRRIVTPAQRQVVRCSELLRLGGNQTRTVSRHQRSNFKLIMKIFVNAEFSILEFSFL